MLPFASGPPASMFIQNKVNENKICTNKSFDVRYENLTKEQRFNVKQQRNDNVKPLKYSGIEKMIEETQRVLAS